MAVSSAAHCTFFHIILIITIFLIMLSQLCILNIFLTLCKRKFSGETPIGLRPTT